MTFVRYSIVEKIKNKNKQGHNIMVTISSFEERTSVNTDHFKLDSGLVLEINRLKQKAILFRNGTFIKTANLLQNDEKRLFVVEAAELGANKTKLARALNISRQTIHNYLETKKHFGIEGLIHSYSTSTDTTLRDQRRNNSHKRHKGNKAKQLAELRKKEKQSKNDIQKRQASLDLYSGNAKIEKGELPFYEEHDWKPSRYAGILTYLVVLITEWKWLDLVMSYFSHGYKIFMIFLLMAARNIRSIEQLKNIRSREGGIALGIERIPSKPTVWEMFYTASKKKLSASIKMDYFKHQFKSSLVGFWLWFTDGHLLPYSGKEKVHYSYNTQRRMVFPGQTNLVTCDESGRIVDFEIEEGKGDLRNRIKEVPQKWVDEIPEKAVQVFDREGHGTAFFSELVKNNCAFVTWEKHTDKKKLSSLDESLFVDELYFNNKKYRLFEDHKSFTHDADNSNEDKHEFTLRRIYVWNVSSKKRTCGLAFSGDKDMTTKDCAMAILSRWGASENTFKHMGVRHPLHYHPGFKLVASDNQEIANPEIKQKQKFISQIQKELNKLYKKSATCKEALKKDGTARHNSVKEQLKNSIAVHEDELKSLKEQTKQLPERVNVSTLENYRSFKKLDNEGKNLFDFVTCSIWNARKQLTDYLRPYYNLENELVDLFYAITECHGWIKSSSKELIVRLEPLQQHRHYVAQKKLCQKLTQLGAHTPTGKRIKIEIGNAPV